jgi:predicted Ser/Thr protein kinase
MALNLAPQTEFPGTEEGPEGTKIVPQPTPTIEEIARLFPQLEILECLGRGGMGVVYKARQPRLDRWVALKIISPGKEKNPHFAERFAREARSLARLSHQSIVTVHDFGEVGGNFFLLMEYVDGVNLRSLLRAQKMAPEAALRIVPAICEALQYAHQQGIVHRDIKPENILIDKQGRVKIADFGIAKMLGTESPQERLTGEQQVVGTPNYMAPEQVEKPASVDHRADIYSLGVVFYEMLTGELPLGKFQPPSNKVHIDVRLDEIVLHALEKEPERRYQQAAEVKTALETLAEPSAARVAAVKPPVAPDPWAQVRGPAIGLIITGILNWVVIPLIFMTSAYFVVSSSAPPAYVWLIPLAMLLASSFILLAGFKMKGLEAWRLAVAGSILAMIITPGNVIGLPLGVWSLVVLFRRETREAFAARAAGRLGPAPVQPAGAGWKWGMVAVAAALILLLAIPVGGIILGIVLPALSSAKAKATRSQELPTYVVTGKVTDARTGKPVAGVRVYDNDFSRRPKPIPQEARTDATGDYELKTWYEEHTVAASAEGYETAVKVLQAKSSGQPPTAVLDFELHPVEPFARLAEAPTPVQTGSVRSSPIPSEPQVLRVLADGSGTHATIQAAIDAAATGAVIHIGPGRFEAPLTINKALTLVGEGWQQTFISPPYAAPNAHSEFDRRIREAATDAERRRIQSEFAASLPGPVLQVTTTRPVVIAGIRFTLPGVPSEGRLMSSTVVQVNAGEVTMRDCAIVGSHGNGLTISQGANVTVSNCLVAAAWNTGIQIERASKSGRVLIVDSDIRNCHYAGITARAENVEIRRCRVSGSAWHGIRYDNTSPLIEGSLIFANARSGIYASGRSEAQVRGNVFWKNEMNGLSAWFNNRDAIHNNTFAANLREGLAIVGASEPTLRQNIFWSNPVGISIGDVNDSSASARASGRLNLRDSVFWTNGVSIVFNGAAAANDPSLTNRFTLGNFAGCQEKDPEFRDPARGDFSVRSGSAHDAGASQPLALQSPWPLQPEEKAIIPETDTRDSRAWRRPAIP